MERDIPRGFPHTILHPIKIRRAAAFLEKKGTTDLSIYLPQRVLESLGL
jgi:hypothetical protein